jgi:dynein intermediate chain 2
MEVDTPYKRQRWQFGRPCSFSDTPPQTIAHFRSASPPSALLRATRQTATLDTSSPVAASAVETESTPKVSTGTTHVEGAWPEDIDSEDFEATRRYRRKAEKGAKMRDARGLPVTLHEALAAPLKPALGACRSNNAIDLMEVYFEGEQWNREAAPSARGLAVFRDPSEVKREAACVDWHPEGASRLAVAYASLRFQDPDEDAPGRSKLSYVWDMARTSRPRETIEPPSPLCSLRFRPRDASVLVGGCYNGLVCLFDVRRGARPVESSLIEKSHHDPVYDCRFVQGKGGNAVASVSTDGSLMRWDVRRMKEPTSVVALADASGRVCGGRSFAHDLSRPHKLLVGTEQGLLLGVQAAPSSKDPKSSPRPSRSGTKKARDADATGAATGARAAEGPRAKRPPHFAYLPEHTGPVVSIQRCPLLPDYFLTVGDWTARLWKEGLISPIVTSPYSDAPLTAACWSATRPGLFFCGREDGVIDFWDFFAKQDGPSLSLPIGEGRARAVRSLQAQARSHEFDQGALLAAGDAGGAVHVLELCRGLVAVQHGERAAMTSVLERETRREKNLLAATKRARRRRKIERAMEKARAEDAELMAKREDEMDEMLTKIDQDFLAMMRSVNAKQALKHIGDAP